jgi:DNA-binding PucR family transcriptional regulator
LATYLEDGRAVESTARKLFIHRNTLRYRLGRIEKFCGGDLNDPDHRFNLALACRAWNILNLSDDAPMPLNRPPPAAVTNR